MFTDFNTRRTNILDAFKKAKNDLEALNSEIDTEIAINAASIKSIQQEQSQLQALRVSNKSSIKNLTSIIGE